MSRYVEYDSLVADSYESDMWDRGTQRFNLRVVEVDDIENAPSIDLVRCAECRYCTTDIIVMQTNNGYERVINLCQCPRHKEEWSVDKDWYCADGERKESE